MQQESLNPVNDVFALKHLSLPIIKAIRRSRQGALRAVILVYVSYKFGQSEVMMVLERLVNEHKHSNRVCGELTSAP